MDEKFHKVKILKPEDDTDIFGDKGNFLIKKDFCLGVLSTLSDVDLNTIVKNVNIPS